MVSCKFMRISLIISFLHPAYPQNVILLSERVLLTSQVECDAGQCLHSITVDFILQDRGETGGIIWEVCFIIAGGMHVSCHYPAFIQLRSNGFHQQRHGGRRPSDVGGARVNHSRAALGAEHHLHPHWNAGEKRDAVGNPAHVGCAHVASSLHIYPFMVISHLPVSLVPM